MKFSGLSLLFFSAVSAQNEIDLMDAKKAERVVHGGLIAGMCNNKPLDPHMLISRVRRLRDVKSFFIIYSHHIIFNLIVRYGYQ